MNLCEVAVNYPKLNSTLTYKVPDGLELKLGSLVEVPLGNRKAVGCVINLDNVEFNKDIKYKEVTQNEKEHFTLSQSEIDLFQWVSKYYVYSMGKLVFDCLPPYMKKVKDPVSIQGEGKDFPIVYNEKQKEIISSVNKHGSEFHQNLIHGVTGSGKSLVFLELIKKTLKKGKSVQFLVPEINLTPQFIDFFSQFLDCKIFVFHSSITNSQRFNLWRSVKNLETPVLVIGVRSSVFLPVSNLGMMIVDEEHDPSFKQEDRCRYNARDVAIKKCQLLNIPIVMGSATPTVESFYRFKNKNSQHYYELRERFNDSKLPLINICNTPNEDDPSWPIKNEVIEDLKDVVKAGGQAIVFVNKLGFSKYLQCSACYHNFQCPNCSINLTYFKNRSRLECHCCEYKTSIPKECPECGCLDIHHQGFGTEKVLKTLQKYLDGYNIDRFDRDELKKIKDVESALNKFQSGDTNILVGTQMISKGHNLRNVHRIVILGMDSYLHSPDFRASERIYQLIQQVSGRAGRFGEAAEVMIQSDINPKFFKTIQDHEFSKFYENEIEVRERLTLPPFSKMTQLSFEGKNDNEARSKAVKARQVLDQLSEKHKVTMDILGPTSAVITKRKNRYYWNLLLSYQDASSVNNLLSQVFKQAKGREFQGVIIDVDPYHIN